MGVLDLFYPKLCVGCKKEGKYICDNCRKRLIKPEQICPMCCKPSVDGWNHSRCKRREGIDKLIIGLPYKGIVQDCLKKIKYRNGWNIIEFLFEISNFPQLDNFVVTSVPMWRSKESQRGFNQAELLGQLLAKTYKFSYEELLLRTRETKPMFGLKKNERIENISGVFVPIKKNQFFSRVILVDDVWTTGATMRECAKVLKIAGVREIWGITLAR